MRTGECENRILRLAPVIGSVICTSRIIGGPRPRRPS